tara:strand:- start:1032 stop:1436 length:405 start_codon:yes stop_codon:yes gene_type:complete
MIDFKIIKNNFDILEGIDRLQYLIDLSNKSEDILDKFKINKNRVKGCVSTSFLIVERVEPTIRISTDSDSKLVKGLLFVLESYVYNKTKQDILDLDVQLIMKEISIKNAVTSQRTNGFYSAIKKLKRDLIIWKK